MLFECWVIYLGLRYLVLCLLFSIKARQGSTTTNNNNANNKSGITRRKSKKAHKSNASSSADNTENEQEPKGDSKKPVMPSPYSSTPIAITKRSFQEIAEDDDDNTTESNKPAIDLEDDVFSSSGITSKPTGRVVVGDTNHAENNNTPIIKRDTIAPTAQAIKRDNIYGAVFKNNNAARGYGYGGASNNNNSDPYGGTSKYGYYGKKSFASVKAAASMTPATKHKVEFTVGDQVCDRQGEAIDWNAQFQGLLQLPEATEEQKQDKYEQLSALSKDFLHVAVTFGRIIISEAYMDPAYRTIVPVPSVGGHAGGVKYIYHGVMFKFACDWMNLYGGDAYAMKAGGHELKSLMRYYGREGIHVPLMALIDFRGFRLVAMSILPIKGKDTLVYGSEDGGKNVAASNEDFNEKMRDIGTRLNLKGHMAGLGTGQELQFLVAPCDIEGHIGTDGLYYVIDFARTFPPTAGDGVAHEFLYKLFRPEFLQNYPIPLSSDAYSRFGGSGNDVHNQEVHEATEYLLKSVVPRFASWLEQGSNWASESADQLTEILHREGINVRYLGLVRKHLQRTDIKQFILVEMVARVVKNMIRQKLRNKMKVLRTLEEGCYIKVVVDFFNVILGYHPVKSQTFWETKLPKDLDKQFEGALSAFETFDFSKCRDQIDHYRLFTRVQTLSGIKLTAQALADLKNDPKSFKVVLPDIETMEARVKYMNTVSLAEGNALALQCMRAPGSQRLFRLTTDKFERAVRATPDSIDVLNNYGDVLENLAQKSKGKDCYKYFERSMQIYRSAQNYSAIVRLAKNLPHIAESNFENMDQLLLLAVKCYEAVLDFTNIPDPELTKFTTMVRFADLLIDLAKMHNSDAHYERAGEFIAEANDTRPKGHPPLLPEWTDSVSNMEKALVWEILVHNTPTHSPTIAMPAYLESDNPSATSVRRASALKANTSALAGAIHAKAFVYKGTATPAASTTPNPEKGKGIRTSSEKGKEPAKQNDPSAQSIPIVTPNVSTHPTRVDSANLYKKSLLSTWLLDSIFKNWGPRMEILALGASPLDDSVVASMHAFARLSRVDLRKNRSVTDALLRKFPNVLAHVTHLNLSHTSATDSGVSHLLWACTSLQHVELAGCSVTEKVFDGPHASLLQHVNVSQSQAHKICGVLAKYSQHLTTLIAAHLHITDNDIWALCRTTRELTKLDLSHSYVSDDGIRNVTIMLPKLTHIELSSCRYVTAKTVSILETRSDDSPIAELVLNKCGMVKQAGLNWAFPYLVRLEISQYFMANDGILYSMGRNCPLLQRVVLSGCHSMCTDVNGIIAMTRQCTRLVHLDLSETAASDSTIHKVAPHLEGLTFLSMLKCTVGDSGATAISQHCTKLESLNLSGCTNVSDTAIAAISERCTRISELLLGNCVLLTDEAAQHIGEHLHALATLDMSSCLLLTDLTRICRGAPRLRAITLAGCENVTDASIACIARLPHLRVLHLVGCKRITDGALGHFSSAAPSLKSLYLGANKTSDSAVAELQQTRMDMEVFYRDSAAASAAHPQRALKSLMRDWKYIQENPLPLISASPLEHNMFIWHANVLGPENTPYWRGLFHIELRFPTTYPSTSPSATVLTPLPHPHVHANGKICLDMLSDFQGYFQSMDVGVKVKGTGWSSAYSVQTLLLQIQTFLMSVEPDEDAPGGETESLSYLRNIPQAIQQSLKFTCSSCSHAPNSPWPPMQGPSSLQNEAAPEKEENEQQEEHSELLRAQREMVCFHTRVNFLEDILGVGVVVKRLKSGTIDTISSTLDLLSRSAFTDGVRTSVMGEDFTHWLPLYINEEHANRAHPFIKKALSEMCAGRDDRFEPIMAVTVLAKLMNSMVVSLMSEQMHASIKALEGYCAFHRLLLLFVKEYPELITNMNEKIENFVNKHAHRHKRYVPALGEFLPLLTVSKFQWKDIAQAYIDESFDRNVKWLLVKYPELEYMADDRANDTPRLSKTFTGNVVSIRLLLFHVHFLQQVAKPSPQYDLDHIASVYDQRFGQPPLHVKQALQSTVKDILRVHTWDEFFTRIGLPVPTPTELVKRLHQAIINSAARGYHKAAEKGIKPDQGRCANFFRTGYCKYDDNCRYSHVDEGGKHSSSRRLSSSDHTPTHAALASSSSMPSLPRSASSTSIGSDGSDYNYRSQRRNSNNPRPHLNLTRSGGSDGGFYSSTYNSYTNNYENNNNNNNNNSNSPNNYRNNSERDRNYHNKNNNNHNSERERTYNSNNNYGKGKGKGRDTDSPRETRGRSYSNSSSHSNNPYSNLAKSANATSSGNKNTPTTHHTPAPPSPQQPGYYDKSGLFIPHASPLPPPPHTSKPPLVHSSSWKGWSQPDATKSRESVDPYLETNFPVLQAAAFAKSATNSDAGSCKYTSSEGALDGESDVSFSGDKSDTTSVVDDFNFVSEQLSPRPQYEEEHESPSDFANIFNVRTQHSEGADIGAGAHAAHDADADAGAHDADARDSSEGITVRGAGARTELESHQIKESFEHDNSSNGHTNGSQNGKGKQSLAEADDGDTENGIVVVQEHDEGDNCKDLEGQDEIDDATIGER